MRKQSTREEGKILDRYITGYHEYMLDDPVHVSCVSQNLCDMIQYSSEELVSGKADLYMPLVHPADSGEYQRFLAASKSRPGSRSLEYRLVKRDGEVIHVLDNMVSERLPDGRMAGYSTLTDISSLREETENVRFINDTVPCGLLCYTCEKTPRVTYVNDQMLALMHISREDPDAVDLYRSSIYLMVSPESRPRLARALNSVFLTGRPYAGEISVVKGNGEKGRLFGWITKRKDRGGGEEFQSICMDVTERYERKKGEQESRYIEALSGAYSLVFEFNREEGTVRLLHGSLSWLGGYLEGIPMQLEAATEKWLDRMVPSPDRGRLKRFLFANITKRGETGAEPQDIYFKCSMEDGGEREYQGIFIDGGTALSYFCCTEVTPGIENSTLREKNEVLKDQNRDMAELVRRFTDGVVAFEIEGERVRPLYLSGNAYAFFGFSEKEWAQIAKDGRPIREFVARTGVGYGRFEELFQTGEAIFTYTDTTTGMQQDIRAVCSGPEGGEGTKKYVMLYRTGIKDAGRTLRGGMPVVQIRTFGYFDVFVNGKPIMFKSEKAKELLALLVDRRGGYVTAEEAISTLWEDEPASPVVLARYRKVALRLRNILEEHGVSGIVEAVNGKRRIAADLVECDLFRYLSSPEESNLFHGSYLTNYSWGETTLGELTGY